MPLRSSVAFERAETRLAWHPRRSIKPIGRKLRVVPVCRPEISGYQANPAHKTGLRCGGPFAIERIDAQFGDLALPQRVIADWKSHDAQWAARHIEARATSGLFGIAPLAISPKERAVAAHFAAQAHPDFSHRRHGKLLDPREDEMKVVVGDRDAQSVRASGGQASVRIRRMRDRELLGRVLGEIAKPGMSRCGSEKSQPTTVIGSANNARKSSLPFDRWVPFASNPAIRPGCWWFGGYRELGCRRIGNDFRFEHLV